MGLKKGMTNNRSGRKKGATNKITSDVRQWYKMLIDKNRDKFESDLEQLEPFQRVTTLERLSQFVIPKLQSLGTQEQIKIEYLELERLLNSAPDEAVQRIADKVMQLKELSKQKK